MAASIQTFQTLGIGRLSLTERIALVQDIWDSIAQEAERASLSNEQKKEIDRRLAVHETNPELAIPWELVESEALRRLGS